MHEGEAMPAPSRYIYAPLRNNHIRILHILPGHQGDILESELHIVDLDDCNPDLGSNEDRSRTFEALSYVWGSNAETHTLHISNQILGITTSLHSALTRLRYPDRPRRLWADAVCINQLDVTEKVEQIPLMARIYSTATRVVADLGDASADSDAALDLIDRYWRVAICHGIWEIAYGRYLSAQETATLVGFPSGVVDMSWAQADLPSPDSDSWIAVSELLHRPWSTRMWIVQEFILAREIVFYCGNRTVNWRVLLALMLNYRMKNNFSVIWALGEAFAEKRSRLESFGMMMQHRCHRELEKSVDGRALLASLSLPRTVSRLLRGGLVDLLHNYQEFSCTIERDRYFSLLGLATDLSVAQYPELKPDYTTNDEEWELMMAKFLLRLPSGRELFLRAGLISQTDSSSPSWMQTFGRKRQGTGTVKSGLCDLDDVSRTSGIEAEFSSDDLPDHPDAVVLRGFQVDQVLDWTLPKPLIDKEGHFDMKDATSRLLFEHLGALDRSIETFYSHYVSDTQTSGTTTIESDMEFLKALVKILTTNPGPGLPNLNTDFVRDSIVGFHVVIAHYEENFAWFKKLGDGMRDTLEGNYPYDEDDPSALIHAQQFLASASTAQAMSLHPAITDEARMAYLPEGVQKGDEVWIISGCQLPVLLRRSFERTGLYRLVGTCYVHGVMMGEMLLEKGFAWGQIALH